MGRYPILAVCIAFACLVSACQADLEEAPLPTTMPDAVTMPPDADGAVDPPASDVGPTVLLDMGTIDATPNDMDAAPPAVDADPDAMTPLPPNRDATPPAEQDASGSPDAGIAPDRDAAPEYVSPWPEYVSEIYADIRLWNCHPERADGPCARPLDSTIVHPDGRLERVPLEPVADGPVDCFYIYPTCSMDPGSNADLEAGEEELFVTELQTARLRERCRVFAPEYRQVSVAGLVSNPSPDAWSIAYADVVDAFKHYMNHENGGRGVILIGHSQGGMMLTQLMNEEIDDNEALRRQLVGAYILGAGVEVPDNDIVGGTFDHIPLCTAADEYGCVVTYASYRANEVFGPQHPFGRTNFRGRRLGCVNPAQLLGTAPALGNQFPARFRSQVRGFILGNTSPFADAARVAEIETPFFSVPGLIHGECVFRDNHHFLSVTVHPDPADPRADEIGGDMVIPGWGLHMVDVNLALDDISALVARQIAAYQGAVP